MMLTGDDLLIVLKEYADKLSTTDLIDKCGYGDAPGDFYMEVIYANNPGMKEAAAVMEADTTRLAELLETEWNNSPRKYVIGICGKDEVRYGYNSVVMTALSRWKRHPLAESDQAREVSVFMEYEDDDKEDYIEISDLDAYELNCDGIKSAIGSFMQELVSNNGRISGSFPEQSEEFTLLEKIKSYYVQYAQPEENED
jgi:hypothetical protein